MINLFIILSLFYIAYNDALIYNIRGEKMNPKMTTNYFKILEAVFDNQLKIGQHTYCPLGQSEIGEIVGCNRMTVNSILKELKDDGYIEYTKSKQYLLTPKGQNAILKSKDID